MHVSFTWNDRKGGCFVSNCCHRVYPQGGHRSTVSTMSFSRDGKYLVSSLIFLGCGSTYLVG